MYMYIYIGKVLVHESTFAERGRGPQPQEERNRQNRRQCARECGAPCQPCKQRAPDTISEKTIWCTQQRKLKNYK